MNHTRELAKEQFFYIDSQITKTRRRIHGLTLDDEEIKDLEDFEKFCEIQKKNISEKYPS